MLFDAVPFERILKDYRSSVSESKRDWWFLNVSVGGTKIGANYIRNNKEGSMDMNIGNQRVE